MCVCLFLGNDARGLRFAGSHVCKTEALARRVTGCNLAVELGYCPDAKTKSYRIRIKKPVLQGIL